ncbi:sensor histidine kinase [Cohnella sp. CFH 77786]|uniref:sensor histidine kinase n=1 Tax=Cohnella sp. CFH 77786 TaxID=2662265 RepID=UPI001C60BDBA|nr:histidine kinase [Cohnella sp. CFH 77786]MBW5446967.1 sensor histidine kinase [Cohnella sp. CFH 77786]
MKRLAQDRRLKWLILLIPTLTIGLWEYVRHTFLLSFMSMELGNLLAPFIVLGVTLTVVRGLFARLEQFQAALQRERTLSGALEEREKLARELHDGIAQSLFLLAVKLDKLDRTAPLGESRVLELSGELKETVRIMHEDVRQAIANLRMPPTSAEEAWVVPLRELLQDTANVTEARAEFHWSIRDEELTGKEKNELHACLREALINVRKHARATRVFVRGETMGEGGFRCTVEDDGVGFAGDPLSVHGRFGLRMVRDRAKRMGWTFAAERKAGWTVVEIAKPGEREKPG